MFSTEPIQGILLVAGKQYENNPTKPGDREMLEEQYLQNCRLIPVQMIRCVRTLNLINSAFSPLIIITNLKQ